MVSLTGSASSFDGVEVLESQVLLLRDLDTTLRGLSAREAERRLVQYGPNALRRRGGAQWPRELGRQLTHPLALLLWLAAGLSLLVGSQTVGIAVVLVIVLNAAFAFAQELQAERAVEALAGYMPQHANVLRDGAARVIEAVGLVPGDVVLLEEGERIAADMRLLAGAVEVDLSTLTGESVPVLRSAELQDADVPRLVARDLVFSGTTCTGGEAQAVVFATGMHTELGRIAALTERVKEEPSPLERQVRRVAWLIAGIAVGMAIAFVPLAIFAAGLSVKNSVVFAVGLLAGNVPEGLLPVITLALAGARAPRRAGQAPERRRDARVHRCHLHRQDWDADREPDAPDRSVDHGLRNELRGQRSTPALRRADIGVAMGLSGTDVAREAATMVLTDDNFASIVAAVEEGRVVYDNVRKFIVYIFAHATPEVVPFLVFALAGGAVPLPLTVLQLLAFDVGTETLPSLALGRDPAEPGIMQRPPRKRPEGVIRRPMLLRAWLFLGLIVAALSMGGFFYVLTRADWHPGDPVGVHSRLHHAYLQATTMTFLGMIFGQIGSAFAVRTQRASLRSVGVFSNRYLLLAVAAELVLAAVFVFAPPLQTLLGTAALPASDLALLLPYPFIVCGADELRRYIMRHRAATAAARTNSTSQHQAAT